MNRRELRKALKAYSNRESGAGRAIAFLLASSDKVPRALRSHLADAARAALLCDTYEHAPAGARAYNTFYAERDEAIERLANVALDVFRPREKPTPQTELP